jgi:hypothetical protein
MWWHTTTTRSTWQHIRRGARLTLLQLVQALAILPAQEPARRVLLLGTTAILLRRPGAHGRIALGRLNQMLQHLPALHCPRLSHV